MFTGKILVNLLNQGFFMNKRANSGLATAQKMTPEQRRERAMKGVQAKKAKASLPKVKYRGELKIGDIILDVAVLDNQMRVITQTAVFNALGRPARGNARLINTPVFMDAKNLQPFISQELREVINKIEFVDLNGKVLQGYNALILPRVARLYQDVKFAGQLHPSQVETARKAEILLYGLGEVGITALVDEATGYQDARAKDALAKILESFVAKELQPWLKTFPDEYYRQIFRLYGLEYPPTKSNYRPQFIGRLTNNVVYERLAPEILPELKKEASKLEKKARLHQFLTSDVGHPKLREHLASLITLLKLSSTPQEFKEKVDLIHPKFGNNYEFEF